MLFQLEFVRKATWVTKSLSGRSSYSMQKSRQETYWYTYMYRLFIFVKIDILVIFDYVELSYYATLS